MVFLFVFGLGSELDGSETAFRRFFETVHYSSVCRRLTTYLGGLLTVDRQVRVDLLLAHLGSPMLRAVNFHHPLHVLLHKRGLLHGLLLRVLIFVTIFGVAP